MLADSGTCYTCIGRCSFILPVGKGRVRALYVCTCRFRFILPVGKPEDVLTEEGTMETVMQTQTPPGLQPLHKAAVVQFLERVYGIEDQITFFRLLENGFLPDLRAAITLEAVGLTTRLSRYQ